MNLEYLFSDIAVIFASLLSSFGVYFSYHILLNRSRTTTIRMIKEISLQVRRFYDDTLQISILYQFTLLSFALIPVVVYVISYIEINNGINYISKNHPFTGLLWLAIFYVAEIIIFFYLITPHKPESKNGKLSRVETLRFMLRKYATGLVSFIVISSYAVFYKYFTIEEEEAHATALYLVPYFHWYLITGDVPNYTSLAGYALIYSSLLSIFILLVLILSVKIGWRKGYKWSFLDYENQLYEMSVMVAYPILIWLGGEKKNNTVSGSVIKMNLFLELRGKDHRIHTFKWDQIIAVSEVRLRKE